MTTLIQKQTLRYRHGCDFQVLKEIDRIHWKFKVLQHLGQLESDVLKVGWKVVYWKLESFFFSPASELI